MQINCSESKRTNEDNFLCTCTLLPLQRHVAFAILIDSKQCECMLERLRQLTDISPYALFLPDKMC